MLKPEHLQTVLTPYGLRASCAEFLRSSQNLVYSCAREDGTPLILRVSIGRYRTAAQVEAELDWISFLAEQGMAVCRPVSALDGSRCLSFDIEGVPHLVSCFEHAPGHKIGPQDLDLALYEKLGVLLGRLHSASPVFAAHYGPVDRPMWDESRLLRQDLRSLGPVLTPLFLRGVESLIEDVRLIPRNGENFGLIHSDVSFGNCFVHEGGLWLFDFDNCEHGFFEQDLATVLYDSIYCRVLNKFADPELTERMLPRWQAFWSGYAKTGLVKSLSAARIETFFLLREAVIYGHYHRILDVTKVGESFRAGLEVIRRNIEAREHQVDFERLASATASPGCP